METIANKTEAAPPGEDEPTFDIPLSGKVLKPSALTQAQARAAGDPFDVVVTAAPRYDGLAHQVVVRRSWKTVAEQLASAGVIRAGLSTPRGHVGSELREPVREKIRQIWKEAYRLSMPIKTVADLLGVTRQTVYDILGDLVAEMSPPMSKEEKAPKVRRMPGPHPPNRPWTDAEVEVLKNLTLTDRECADQLNRHVTAVRMKRRWLVIEPPAG
jgi:hypothetical protein